MEYIGTIFVAIVCLVLGYVMGRIKKQQQAEKDLGWHSVDESLPEIDEEVIVLCSAPNNGQYYDIYVGHLISDGIFDIRGVKYWMPCPKIPEK
ncbi:MAG: DUF551 domain-containing protein [Bacteroidaceae bacterium]|nr:DUF551 domain-containing protein [Bacteroidaceae bacterium]